VAETSANLHALPPNLPAPADDGACDHLPGSQVPPVRLASTGGRMVDLAEVAARPTVFFFYPRTGEPGKAAGPEWDAIPGARGCTPQSCGFRDLHREFTKLGVAVFGVSTQETAYQGEFIERNHVPFELLSDRDLLLTQALRLLVWTVETRRRMPRPAASPPRNGRRPSCARAIPGHPRRCAACGQPRRVSR